ncbi:hypothetical protein [Cumulibacter manganitolerans]|uniref:hypothetical protein n=1 Tax=Cumulibacter manganitolerans TaxID=1884992 RepID=UPI0012966044|nr:hypothetical protein [Cumulibacter manganitolerans]
MTDPRTPYDAHDPFALPAEPPTARAPQPTAPPPYGAPDEEYVITSGLPAEPATYRNAPDPFGGTPSTGAYGTGSRRPGSSRWVLAAAAVLALALVAAAAYFLLIKKDDGSSAPADGSRASAQGRSSAPGSEPSGDASGSATGTPSAPGAGASLAGSYDVNGTIAGYTGPQTGQLGSSAKKAGDPAFKTPQTWTLSGGCVAGEPCELAISPGGAQLTLTLDGGTWKGTGSESIQCSPAGQPTEATVTVEIPQSGGTATRTLTATCGQPLTEVDTLTLTRR